MYGVHVSSHSSTSRAKRAKTQHTKTATHRKPYNVTADGENKYSSFKSITRQFFGYIKETWTGIKMGIEECEFDDLDGQQVRIKPEAIDTLCQVTKFTRRELQLMYRGFKQDCPSGVVKEDTFKIIYAQFFPRGADSSQYAHYIFNTFDPDHTGGITFTDFVVGLSVLARGTAHDKLRWAFSLYDLNGDGVITKDELERIVSSVYDLMGRSLEVKNSVREEGATREHVDRVFQRLDLNHDGMITVDEFLDSCLKDEMISKSLDAFNTFLL